jgi:hypothetical protein
MMLLGGVTPLDKEAEALWEAITGQYIMDEIRDVLGELRLSKAEVTVDLAAQKPPFIDSGSAVSRIQNGGQRQVRRLQESEQDLSTGNFEAVEQELTFDAIILLQSILTEHDINRYIVGAFDEESEQLSYLMTLRATGHPAFANANSVSIMGPSRIEKLDESENPIDPVRKPEGGGGKSNNAKSAGLAAGLTVVAVIGMALAVLFVLKGRRSRQRTETVPVAPAACNDILDNGFDSSEIEVHTRTDVSSLGDPFPPNILDLPSSSSAAGSKSTSKGSGPLTLDYDYVQEIRNISSQSASDSQTDSYSASLVTRDDKTLEAEYFQLSRFDVEAPAGRLGIVLETANAAAPVVQAISDSSPLAGQIQEGDTLLSVDGIDVTDMSASDVSEIIASKQTNAVRHFSFAMSSRMMSGGDIPSIE